MNNLISFKIGSQDLEELNKIAEEESRSRSNVIKLAIKKYLEENARKTRTSPN